MAKSNSNFSSVIALVSVLVVIAAIMFWLMLDLATIGRDPLPRGAGKPDGVGGGPSSADSVLPEYKLPPVAEITTKLKFADATADAQLNFHHAANFTPERYLPEIMSGGVLVADFNNDRAPDIWCINGGRVAAGELRPADCSDRLFLNDGQGKFQDVTDSWGVSTLTVGFGMGGAVGDFDNDGWTDVFLTSWLGGDRLLRNTGAGFVDATTSAGLAGNRAWGTSTGFFDFDRDGDLDLYVVRYVDYTMVNAFRCYVNNIHVYCAPLYPGVPDQLFRNNGDGTFSDISETAFPAETRQMKAINGVEDLNKNKGLAVGLGDLNGDGWPDIYVANDISRNMLYVNRGDGTFDEVGREVGVAYGEDGKEQSGMGVAFSDTQATGRTDIVCTNFQKEPTNLYIQSNGFMFADRADQKGIGATSRARLSFGISFFDPDNDGDEDLAVANGHIHDNVAVFSSDVAFAQPNTLYEALGDGKFRDITTVAGPAWQDVQVTRGLAVGDFDGDGRQDLIMANNNGSYQLLRNESVDVGRFVTFRLAGKAANRSGLGTVIILRCGEKTLRRELYGATSYMASSDPIIHFGTGLAEQVTDVQIHWPTGETQSISTLETNRHYFVEQGQPPQALGQPQ